MGEPSVGMLLDGYELRDVVREDAAAVVFRGHHVDLRRDVELRVLRAAAVAGDPGARQRFREAAVTTAALEHPGIVPIYAFGTNETTAWVASRLLEGRTLQDDIAAGPMSARRSLAIIEQLADALDATHRAGIVHRDVRPGTVWPIGRHVLLGLPGVARSDGATRILDDALLGDPQTLAPEQLTGDGAVPASDVYALGAIFLSCVLGGPPFGPGDLGDVLRRRATGEPPKLGLDGVPCDALNDWLEHTLARSPEARPASAGLASRELRAALECLPSEALDRPGALSPASPAAAARASAQPPGKEEAPPAAATRVDRQRPSLEALTPPEPPPSRWRVVALVVAAIALPALAFFAGRTSVGAQGRDTVSVGALSVQADDSWTAAEPAARGAMAGLMARERVLRGPGGMTAEAGMLRRTGPPSDPLAYESFDGRRRNVLVDGRPAVIYDGVVGGRAVHAVALQSDRGTGVIACSATVLDGPRRAACDALASSVTLTGRAVRPVPDRQLAEVVATTMLSLHNLVITRQLTMGDAKGAKAREDLADVEELYKRAIADLSSASVAPADRVIVSRLVARLRAVVDAYDALRASANTRTRTAAIAAVDELRTEIRRLRALGYGVGQ